MEALTAKETAFLNDAKKQEELCIEKYNKYSAQASDTQLKTLFQTLSQKEQQHLDSLNQILSGTVPQMKQSQSQPIPQPVKSTQPNINKQADSFLCQDTLASEKHVSSNYNTAIFEFRDTNIRNVLNHIQKEEQQHGEQLYNYMAQNGLYN